MYKASKATGILSEWIDALMKFKALLKKNKPLLEKFQALRKTEDSMEDDIARLEQLEREEVEFNLLIEANTGKIS